MEKDLDEFINSYKEKIKLLQKRLILKQIDEIAFKYTPYKLIILITTSALKQHQVSKELLSLIKTNKFFHAMSTLRIMLEETIIIGFVLSESEKFTDIKKLDLLLNRVSAGYYSGRGKKELIPNNQKPIRIGSALKIAEEYIKNKDKNLDGIFNDTYDFISEYVHPNGPSRFHFFKRTKNIIEFYNPKITIEDMKMILNYGCMILDAYIMFLNTLNQTDILVPINKSLEENKKLFELKEVTNKKHSLEETYS